MHILGKLRPWLQALGLALRTVRVPVRQQFQTTECGVAALGMILAHHGRHVSNETLRAITGVSRDCVNAADIRRAAHHFGLDCKAYTREPDQLKDLPLPFLAHIRFIHFLVVEGFADGHVLTVDPAGGRNAIPTAQFDEAFTGVVLTFAPGQGFRTGGDRPRPLLAWGRRMVPNVWQPASLALAAGMAGAFCQPAVAWLLGRWLDALPGAAAANLWSLGAAAAGAGMSQAALLALAHRAAGHLQDRLAMAHARDMAAHYRAVPPGFFTYRLPLRLHQTLYAGEAAAQALCRDLLPGLWRQVLALSSLLLMAALLPVAGLMCATVVVAHAGLTAATLRWHHRACAFVGPGLEDESNDPLHRSELERTKLNGHDREFVAARLGAQAASMAARQEAAGVMAWLQGLSAAAAFALPMLALLAAARAFAASEVTAGRALSLVLLGLMAGAGLRSVWPMVSQWIGVVHTLLPVQDVLESAYDAPRSEDHPPESSMDLPEGWALRATDLVFGYSPTRQPLVSGVSMDLRCGEQVGITGPSGGGKSTLGALLSGDHRPWAGTIAVANAAASGTPTGVVRVDKAVFFFEGSVRENLCLWDASVTEAQLMQVVQDACLDDVLAARPGGLDAPVAPRGENFSGGQRQRLEIARALLRNPLVLVLDEATDALDPSLEVRLRTRLRARGCALVLISHRASTLAACDRVLRVAQGRLVDLPAPAVAPEARTGADPLQGGSAAPTLEPAGPPVLPVPDDDPCRLADSEALRTGLLRIGKALGAVPVWPELAQPGQSLEALGARCGLLLRRVRVIDARWWDWNHGALLARRRDLARLVVWLPGTHDGWRDALTGEPQAIDPQVDLHEVAWRCLATAGDAAVPAMSRIRAAAAGRAGDAWAAVGLALAMAVLVIALPLWATHLLRPNADLGPVRWAGALVALLAIGALEYLLMLMVIRFWSQIDHAVLSTSVQRLPRLPPAFLRSVSDAALGRSLAALDTLLRQLSLATRPALGILVLLALSPLALWHAGLALMVAGMVVAVCAAFWAQPAALARQEAEHGQLRAAEARFLFDTLAGWPRLRLLRTSAAALAHWQQMLATRFSHGRPLAATAQSKAARRLTWTCLLVALLPVLVTLTPWSTVGMPAAQNLAAHQLAASLILSWLVLESALGMGLALGTWRRSENLAHHADLLCTTPLEPVPARAGAVGRLELEAVRYAWPGTDAPALRSASLWVEPGEFVAITGPSGSGKSTLLRLMLGLDNPDAGSVRLDGQPLDGGLASAWRASSGWVTQGDNLEAAGTLRSQLCGLAPVDAMAVWHAIETVMMGDDVRRMPMGLQTIVETGKLSTGQEQRLLIARELLRQPGLLILDEATNAIADAMQAQLVANLRARGISCILVTHRESAIALMDRVIVLREGTVVWSGKPAELQQHEALQAMLRAERQEGHL